MQLIKIILICAICFTTLIAQNNIVKNGSFSDESSWTLQFYNDSKGSSFVSDGSYKILIEKPGSDPWSVQFTQTGLSMDSGSYYKFSFEVSSNQNRTIEASISKNGGDYISYSGRDSIEVTSVKKRFEYAFMMNYKSDKAARVEFNCGKYGGNVEISNLELVKISGPIIKTKAPVKDDILYEGNPFRITWFSIGIDSVKLELSSDNGLSWVEITPSIPDTGAFIWIPTGNYSPWSVVRVSSRSNPDIKAVTALFEIAPRSELIRNGSFSGVGTEWNFGVYGGKASGAVNTDGVYEIKVETSGSERWHIQFTQTSIVLQAGVTYTLSFIAYAAQNTLTQVDISRYKNANKSFLDSIQQQVTLTPQPHQFTIDFIAYESDLDARLEFNCGLNKTNVFIDNVSLTKKYQTGAKNIDKLAYLQKISSRKVITIFNNPAVAGSNDNFSKHAIVNLMGRMAKKVTTPNKCSFSKSTATGLYISALKRAP